MFECFGFTVMLYPLDTREVTMYITANTHRCDLSMANVRQLLYFYKLSRLHETTFIIVYLYFSTNE